MGRSSGQAAASDCSGKAGIMAGGEGAGRKLWTWTGSGSGSTGNARRKLKKVALTRKKKETTAVKGEFGGILLLWRRG